MVSVNQTNPITWNKAFEGLTLITNPPGGLVPVTLDANTNANAINAVVSAIAAQSQTLPGQIYTGLDQLLAVPTLSLSSPFLDVVDVNSNELTDAAYEALPSQLLPLLRTDSMGTIISTSGPLLIQFTGYPRFPYIVEASGDLLNWTAITTNYTTNGSFIFSDAITSGQKFYRTRLGP